jgi:hypothetical protein
MAELKRKVTIRRKTPKKPILWLWLLVAVITIVVIIFLVKYCSTNDNGTASQSINGQVMQSTSGSETTLSTAETAMSESEEFAVSNAGEKQTVAQSSQPATDKHDTNTSTNPAATLPQGTLEEKAKRVIRGDFGNGAYRKTALGREYLEIQRRVNEKYRNGDIYW